MEIYLNTPKLHCIKVDNVDEAVELIKKLSGDESKVYINTTYDPNTT